MNTTTASMHLPLFPAGSTSSLESVSTNTSSYQGSTVTPADVQPQIVAPKGKRPLPAPSLDEYKITKAKVRKNVFIGALIGFVTFGPVGALIGGWLAKRRVSKTPEQELKRQMHKNANTLDKLNRELSRMDVKVKSSWQTILKTHDFKSVDDLKTKATALRASGDEITRTLASDRKKLSAVQDNIYRMEQPIRAAERKLSDAQMRYEHALDTHKSGWSDFIYDPRQDAGREVFQCEQDLDRAKARVYGNPEYIKSKDTEAALGHQIKINQRARKQVSRDLSPLAKHENLLKGRTRVEESFDAASWERARHFNNYRHFGIK